MSSNTSSQRAEPHHPRMPGSERPPLLRSDTGSIPTASRRTRRGRVPRRSRDARQLRRDRPARQVGRPGHVHSPDRSPRTAPRNVVSSLHRRDWHQSAAPSVQPGRGLHGAGHDVGIPASLRSVSQDALASMASSLGPSRNTACAAPRLRPCSDWPFVWGCVRWVGRFLGDLVLAAA